MEHDQSLDYFGGQVSRTRDYDFGIGPNSPLYPLTYLYRGRMVTWYALESGTVWKTPQLKNAVSRRGPWVLRKGGGRVPGEQDRPDVSGDADSSARSSIRRLPGAPDWAVYQREGLERLADIIEWWIDHRMREDGQYGGGWGDDCEMWRWWTPILIGFESPKINEAQAKFSRAIMSQPHMKLGYTTRMSDVEHTAEDSADAITAMMHIDAGNPDWSQRALRLAELMETLWTGRNERGFLQFKSTYFTAEKLDLTPARACDTVYHAARRPAHPALLAANGRSQADEAVLHLDGHLGGCGGAGRARQARGHHPHRHPLARRSHRRPRSELVGPEKPQRVHAVPVPQRDEHDDAHAPADLSHDRRPEVPGAHPVDGEDPARLSELAAPGRSRSRHTRPGAPRGSRAWPRWSPSTSS